MSNEDQPPKPPKSCVDCTIAATLACMTFDRMKSNIGLMFAHYTGDRETIKAKIFQESALGCPDFTTEKIKPQWG